MCIQALAEVEWDLDLAASNLAGGGESSTTEKLKAKMNRYLSRIDENTKSGTEKKLFNNLPAAYHQALRLTIERLRS